MLICGLFPELLDLYLSLSDHSLADVGCRQVVDSPKTGIAGSSLAGCSQAIALIWVISSGVNLGGRPERRLSWRRSSIDKPAARRSRYHRRQLITVFLWISRRRAISPTAIPTAVHKMMRARSATRRSVFPALVRARSTCFSLPRKPISCFYGFICPSPRYSMGR